MFGGLLKGLFTFIFAFMLGAGYAQDKPPADSELQQKVQEHMDVIVDESAAIVDDVMEEVRQDERVQQMEQFANDVNEIANNTRADIEAHFGTPDTAEETADAPAEDQAAVEEAAPQGEETVPQDEEAAEPAAGTTSEPAGDAAA